MLFCYFNLKILNSLLWQGEKDNDVSAFYIVVRDVFSSAISVMLYGSIHGVQVILQKMVTYYKFTGCPNLA